ncbi:hypothetical protein [Desertibacillus haloalkaliphilus]|uniref:hypothetical protein n=1 Tax=Desertibacillus haloalkaliphilus TaxID=1328930 RepID=UPI001C253F82|nr:hypothetical protein [Desertibacillus haloalkaliphilus]MBU8908099.1 hypothetical protein [Desertibacillus haloalkaliphilus]
MNTLLELYNMKLQYDRGKANGLAGLVAIILFVLFLYYFDHIYPLLDILGIINIFHSLGLVYEGSVAMTLFRIVGGWIALSIIVGLLGIVLIPLFLLFSVTIEFWGKLFLTTLMVPVYALYIIPWTIEAFQFIANPKKFKEHKRSQKRIKELRYIQGVGKEVPKDEAVERLNRLPMNGDHFFMVGVMYDRNFVILLPCPNRKGELLKVQNLTIKANSIGKIIKLEIPFPNRVQNVWKRDIEFVYDVNDSDTFMQMFRNYSINDCYREFVASQHEFYFRLKRNYTKTITKSEDESERNIARYGLEDLLVGNEEIIEMMRNQKTN